MLLENSVTVTPLTTVHTTCYIELASLLGTITVVTSAETGTTRMSSTAERRISSLLFVTTRNDAPDVGVAHQAACGLVRGSGQCLHRSPSWRVRGPGRPSRGAPDGAGTAGSDRRKLRKP